ncbi:MAG: LPS export ABC transporter permease LptF [Candidatus Angelobacter sp. Gp1-AA117]|nr:MAG: LPS export ABC transporter permease LptF [Candidatus Angelobacter sp. Gp1-AA117]
MRIFTRYILKEVLSHGLIGIAVFTFVIFMRDVSRILELVVRNSAPVPSVAELFFLTLPAALTVTIPMGVLVGILIGLSRLAADSEITAMRAAGMGVRRFVRIIAIFGIVAWVLALFNNIVLAPRSAAALAHLQNTLATSQASFEVQPRVFYEDFKNYVLYVQDTSTASGAAVWKNVFLADISTPGATKITLAQRAVVTSSGKDAIHLHMVNGEVHDSNVRAPEQYTISTFNETDTILNLPPTPKPAQELVPVQQLDTGELLRQTYNPNKEFARWYWIEFNRRFALPTACLVLVLIGIPLGLSSKKGGKGAGFVLTIVLVFVYYFISVTGVSLARSGKVQPVLGVWLANIAFACFGMALLWRVDKIPIETGLGQALASHIKNWTHRWSKAREEERSQGQRRQRFFSFPLILDDYVLRNFLGHLALILASFIVLVLIFTFFELLSDIIRNRIALVTVGEYLLNLVPTMLYDVITPLSVLLAVLVTFGLMQKSNEITAMKATGVSIYRAVLPVIVIAAFVAVGLFLLEESYLPYANKRVETLRNEIKRKPAQTYLRPDRKWIFGQNNTIYYYEFYDPDRDQFGSISSFEFDPHTFEITRRIYANRAHWEEGLQKWVFSGGWERSFRGDAIQGFRTFDVSTFAELNEPPTYFKKEVRQSSEMNYEELKRYIYDLQQSGFDVVRLRVQLQKKIAFPLITLVMSVLAVPFALSAGRRGALTGVAVALLIAVVYWATSGLFEAMGNVSQLPPALAAWAPDVLFSLAGGYLVLKTPS